MNKHKFIESQVWAKIRADLFTIRGEKCEICGSKNRLEVHHLTYDRYGGNEEPDDLIILCRYHHALEHNRVTMDRNDKRKAKKLAKKKKKVKIKLVSKSGGRKKRNFKRGEGIAKKQVVNFEIDKEYLFKKMNSQQDK